MNVDAIAALKGADVTVYTTTGTRWVGRVDMITATAAGDPSAIAITLELDGGSVVIPWHAVTEITVTL